MKIVQHIRKYCATLSKNYFTYSVNKEFMVQLDHRVWGFHHPGITIAYSSQNKTFINSNLYEVFHVIFGIDSILVWLKYYLLQLIQ